MASENDGIDLCECQCWALGGEDRFLFCRGLATGMLMLKNVNELQNYVKAFLHFYMPIALHALQTKPVNMITYMIRMTIASP